MAVCSLLAIGCIDDSGPRIIPPVRTADANQAADPIESSTAATAVHSTDGSSRRRSFGGLSFDVPPDWEEVPLTPVQQGVLIARFSIPSASDDGAATLTLSRSGGSVDANLDRWKGQVSGGDAGTTGNIRVAGIDSTRMDLAGLFSPGFGKPPIPDARMIGIVVPMSPNHYFLKLTGARPAVSAVESQFERFVKSARTD